MVDTTTRVVGVVVVLQRAGDRASDVGSLINRRHGGAATSIASAADMPAAASAACASGSAAAPGETTVSFTGAGMDSTYIRHVPPTATAGEPLPMVLDLHGYSEPATVHVQQSGLATYGDTMGFVTAIPQITRAGAAWDSTVGSPDVQYIDELLDELEATVCVDTNRVYVAGLSNGAFMTSILACDLSDRIAAAAPVAGIQAPDDCRPERPVPVVSFHGTADTFVPYTGGLGSSVAALPNADGTGTIGSGPPSSDPVSTGPSVPERAATWAVRNGCAADPTETPVADDVTLGGSGAHRATRSSSTGSRTGATPGRAVSSPCPSPRSSARRPFRSTPRS